MKTRGVIAPAAIVMLLASGCGQQEPSFTEDRSAKRLEPSLDAQGKRGQIEPLPGGENGAADASGAADGDTSGVADGASDGATDGGNDGGGRDAGGNDGGGKDAGGSDAATDGAGNGGSDGMAGGGDAGNDGVGGQDGTEPPLNLKLRTYEVMQSGASKVDILWVVDTSGSMSEEQTYLGQNFNKLIQELKNSGHDFQTAITTTDVCQDTIPSNLKDRVCPVDYGGSPQTRLRGSFHGDGSRKILKSTDSDLVSKFNSYVNRGVDGSGFEHGLWAAKLAVDKVKSGQNAPLVRSDAFLAVIVVSDEEDDGIGLSKKDAYNGHNFFAEGLTEFRFTEDDMITYLKTEKGEGNFSISAITPTRKADGKLCSAPHSQPLEEGTQYIKAAQKTGGIIQSICETNWSASLAKIGVDLAAQITQITLPSTPDQATIKVYVDDVRSMEWTYNSGNNAVKFNAGHVPSEGARIKVVYYEFP